MTSGNTFPRRFTEVDELIRPDHFHLGAADRCYFIGEYTARKGYGYSATNQLILNFKKPMDRKRNPHEWRHKERAIREAAEAFAAALGRDALDRLTFVPVPPSKAKDHPLHDDRLVRMLRLMRSTPTDVRELVVQTESTEPAHAIDPRPAPRQLASLYRIDDTLTELVPDSLAIVDDVLTTGAHFRAVSSVLGARFPNARVSGLFIARRVPAAQAFVHWLQGTPPASGAT